MGAKHKGSNFEREVAKRLSLWWNEKKAKKGELVFWRTHASGSAKHIHKDQAGDITYIDEEGKPLLDIFVIECKRSRRFNLFGIIAGDRSIPIDAWIRQVRTEAYKHNKSSMLIFKLDRYPIMIAIDTPTSKALNCINKAVSGKRILRLYKPFPFDFFCFSEFLSIVKPEDILRLKEWLSEHQR